MALTAKQERFAVEYVTYGNKSRAYRIAYNAEKMPNESIHVKAHEVANNVNVALRIRELEKLRAQTFETNMKETIQGIFQIANFDIAEIYNEDGSMKNIHDIPKHIRTAISGLKTYEENVGQGDDKVKLGETKEVKTYDKLAAFEKLMKHQGGYLMHNMQKTTELSREERLARIAEYKERLNAENP